MVGNYPTLSDSRFRYWFDYVATPVERERFRQEEEQFWAAMDMTVYAETFGDLHPNEGYEYAPIVKIKTLKRS